MATTTNYGWDTPDDTDLVKDGASAIRTLGSSVDTTVKNLNPETTLGDISYRSSTANTNTRLAIGTAGQVLTVDSGVPAWTTISSGGMTLISTTALSGASVTISSIPATYNNLQLVIEKPLPATNGRQLFMRYNSDTASNYFGSNLGSTFYDTSPITSGAFVTYAWLHESPVSNTTSESIFIVDIYQYANTNTYKRSNSYWINNDSTATTSIYLGSYKQIWRQTSAVNSITLQFDTGNITSGTAYLYGVK